MPSTPTLDCAGDKKPAVYTGCGFYWMSWNTDVTPTVTMKPLSFLRLFLGLLFIATGLAKLLDNRGSPR